MVMGYEDVFAEASKLTGKVYLDPSRTNVYLYSQIKANIEKGLNLTSSLKTIKNEVELKNFDYAMEKDGAAMVKILKWVEENAGNGITEWDVSEQLLKFRAEGKDFLEESFERLAAIKLVDLYQTDDYYLVQLHPTLTAEEFFSHNVYSRLLEKKIGEAAADALRPENPSGDKLIKPFMQVFGMEDEQARAVRKANDFGLEYFKQRMAQDNLRFANEKEDVLELFAIAEQKKWTWYETYVLARETAVSQVISTKRMKQKLAQKPAEGQFSKQEQSIIQEAKRTSPMVFLAEIKKTRQAAITRTERKLLLDLAELGLLDEVINVVLLLTFNKVDSANLNEKYALKVANDFSYQKVTTAEEAVLKIRERNQQPQNRPPSPQAAQNRG